MGELETREERLARRFFERRGLSVPVDVWAVARQLAHVAEKSFPIQIDGICLDLRRPGLKPTVWVERSLRHERKRFTLAHEIGHIVIPWHSGTILDDVDSGAHPNSPSHYFQLEGEANRFAAELLMPSSWVEDLCGRALHMRDVMHVVAQKAEVSMQAAALRVLKLGPPGYIVAATTDGIVQWAGRTRGTRSHAPDRGQHVGFVDMPACDGPEKLSYKSIVYFWWKEKGSIKPPRAAPKEDWRTILDRLLDLVPAEQREQIQRSLNAIVGAAIGKESKGAPVEAIYARAVESLQNRTSTNPWMNMILHHREFDDYVLGRVFERAESK